MTFFAVITRQIMDNQSEQPRRKFDSIIAAAKLRRKALADERMRISKSSKSRPDDMDDSNTGASVETDEDESVKRKKSIDDVNTMLNMVDAIPMIDKDEIIKAFPEMYMNYNCVHFLRELAADGKREIGKLPVGLDLVTYQDLLYAKEEIDELYTKNDFPPAKLLPDDHMVLVGMIDLLKWKKAEEESGKTPKLDDARRMFSSAFGPGFGKGPGEMGELAWNHPDIKLWQFTQSVRIAQAKDLSFNRRMWATAGIQWWYTGQREEFIGMVEESGKQKRK